MKAGHSVSAPQAHRWTWRALTNAQWECACSLVSERLGLAAGSTRVPRSRRSPLATTSKLAPMSAKTAIHMVAVPTTAITRKTLLMPSARVMFCQRMAWVRLDRRTVSAMRCRSSFMMTTSAASMAVSVPAAPMAKPMSACASAGASLMPSPVMPVAP